MSVDQPTFDNQHTLDDSIWIPLPSLNRIAYILNKYNLNLYHLSNEDKVKALNLYNNVQLDRKIPIKLKQTEQIVPRQHECTICACEYVPNENISQCIQCKQQLHSQCLSDWYAESVYIDTSIKCPFCRGKWRHSDTIKCVAMNLQN